MTKQTLDSVVATVQRIFAEGKPGVLGLAGKVIERKAARDLAAYFGHLYRLSQKSGMIDALAKVDKLDGLQGRVEAFMHRANRISRPLLQHAIAENTKLAVLQGFRQKTFHEAEPDEETSFVDQLGDTGNAAAKFAAEQSATLVKGIEDQSISLIQAAVSQGIKEQAGVAASARLIRAAFEDMTTSRAAMIAATEVNRAFTFAQLDKMDRVGVEYKRVILSPGACEEICIPNFAQGAIPVDEDFESGDDGPPFHPNCRCAVTGARAPESEDDSED